MNVRSFTTTVPEGSSLICAWPIDFRLMWESSIPAIGCRDSHQGPLPGIPGSLELVWRRNGLTAELQSLRERTATEADANRSSAPMPRAAPSRRSASNQGWPRYDSSSWTAMTASPASQPGVTGITLFDGKAANAFQERRGGEHVRSPKGDPEIRISAPMGAAFLPPNNGRSTIKPSAHHNQLRYVNHDGRKRENPHYAGRNFGKATSSWRSRLDNNGHPDANFVICECRRCW